MQIFEQEKLDGLEENLSTSASISYASVVEPFIIAPKASLKKFDKTVASYDDEDLYYVQSILVSTSWNKNDDIFDPAEVWAAKATPEHKPTNLEHNENDIIGHIISNWPINEDGEIIDEQTAVADLPRKYHILTGSVIYRGFSSPELKERSDKLIAEIEAGTKYVSMECFFKGFDYGLVNKENAEFKVLARNEDTAYLTKYLRAYGGMGEHENYKIGRVLKNITFTGKGFVDRPANSDSIIFNKNLIAENNTQKTIVAKPSESKIDQSLSLQFSETLLASEQVKPTEEKIEKNEQLGVSISQPIINAENITMSSEPQEVNMENTESKTVTEAAEEVVTLASENTEQLTELQAQNEKLQAEISELTETKESELVSVKEEAAEQLKQLEDQKTVLAEEVASLKEQLDAANEVIAAYKKHEEEMLKKEKNAKRMAAFLEAGLDNEAAASKVEEFDSLDDNTFDGLVALLAMMKPKKNEEMPAKDEKKEDGGKMPKASEEEAEEPVDASALEEVEVEEEVNLSIGGESEAESDMESTRAALIDFVKSKIGQKVK